jgi:hypothetical protein
MPIAIVSYKIVDFQRFFSTFFCANRMVRFMRASGSSFNQPKQVFPYLRSTDLQKTSCAQMCVKLI